MAAENRDCFQIKLLAFMLMINASFALRDQWICKQFNNSNGFSFSLLFQMHVHQSLFYSN